MSEREWKPASLQDVRAYVGGILTSPTSLLPGLSGLEAVAAMAYVATLPMRRSRSITEAWGALPGDVKAEWISRTAADLLRGTK
jgi:hypothetical protein